MKSPKKLRFIIIGLVIALLALALCANGLLPTLALASSNAPREESQRGASEPQREYPVMKPSPEMLQNWVERSRGLLEADIDAQVRRQIDQWPKMLRDSFSLLSYLDYIPSERDQGGIGNCWVWAGTGIMEMALHVQHGIKDRLSIQYFDSNYNGGSGDNWAGQGGDLPYFADFYDSAGMAIPWSNTNAYYQDGDAPSDHTNVPAEAISTTPHYPITHIESQLVPTWGVGEDPAITNIKTVLHQGKAMQFAFYQSMSDWHDFFDFWDDQPETTIWEPGFSDGEEWTWDEVAGHGVLCVGYHDDLGTDNDYWIMLNSWGTAEGGRRNGLFRVDMHLNYDCRFQVPGEGQYYAFDWKTLDIAFSCYGFEDPQSGTELYIDSADRTFRFTARDGYDSGPVKAGYMWVGDFRGTLSILIGHKNSRISLSALTVGTKRDCLLALAIDRTKGRTYRLFDPPGIE